MTQTHYLNRRYRNYAWGGGNHFVGALENELRRRNEDIVKSPSIFTDYVHVLGLDAEDGMLSAETCVMFEEQLKSSLTFVSATKDSSNIGPFVRFRINENDARKNTIGVDDRIKRIIRCLRGSDDIVFVSKWLQNYFLSQMKEDEIPCKTRVVINGVDSLGWNVAKMTKKVNRTGKVRIVAHHWSDNPLKGFDVYEKIDEFVGRYPNEFQFTYIGRHRNTFKNTICTGALYGMSLQKALVNNDVYVSASRSDPGPNHCAEALAADLPTYVISTGGGCVEFAGEDHAYETYEQLENIIASKKFEKNSYVPRSWEQAMKEYLDAGSLPFVDN